LKSEENVIISDEIEFGTSSEDDLIIEEFSSYEEV
jgi:hypothetical protein